MEGINNDIQFFRFERIREAREARGYTIRDLAELIGLNNHQLLSKYENGKTKPPVDVIFKLMKVLNFPYNYFFIENKFKSNEEEIVFFRSKANTTKKLKKIHEIKISWLIGIFHTLNEIVDFPESNLPKLELKNNRYFTPTDYTQIEQLAIDMRKQWDLNNGPITDVTHLFEKQGIVVSVINSNDEPIDACSYWIENKLFILVGNDRSSPSRIKFTLAHELGHFLLHSNVRKEEFNKKEVYRRIEDEANHFASSFLLPAKTFSEELISHTLDYYLLLKKRWQVSIQAMVYRSKELNLINDNQSSYLWKQIARKGWRKKEPYDELIKKESPTLLSEAFDLIVNHKVKSKKELADSMSLSYSDIESIANLPVGYFNDATGKAKIIELKKK